MKHLFKLWIAATLLFIAGCSESYDDSALVGRVDNLENRVAKLEELCKQMNNNISSLQTLVNALQNNDYVTGVTPVIENGKTIGYTITFAKAKPITIYHGKDGKDGQNGADGKDGKDGYTPQIGVKQDTDGIYYWTLDGDWLLDDKGNKIKAQGTDGKDGKDGITPQLKIENDYWYISYDNGNSWEQLGKATGEDGKDGQNGIDGTNGKDGIDGVDGDSFFQGVTQDENNVYFTLADGTTLTLPKQTSLSISFDEDDLVVMSPNSTRKIGYTVTSSSESVKVEVTSSADIKVKAVAHDNTGLTGYIEIKTSDTIDEYSKVIVFVSNGDKVIMHSITFEEAGLKIEDNAIMEATAEGGEIALEFLSNVECEVVIPDEAQSWISVIPETRALEKQTITLKLETNEGEARSAEIVIKSKDSNLSIIYTIHQEPNTDYQLALEREALIAFYNATGGDNWKRNDNWCSDKPVSEWYGVYTNPSYYGNDGVCILDLSDNNLTGGIPEEIGDLTFLHSLNLMGNTFTGGIPATIGNLTKLEGLVLSYNNLSGEIPSEIGNCSNLTIIQLNNNRLSGTIPNEIGKLTQLKWLHLHNNNLSGDIPTQIGDCVNLENLNLSNNNISGSIPAKIVNLTNLRDLNIAENKLTGAIPADIGNMRNLIYLQLCDNFLSGNIPESIYQIPTLTLLHLSRNKLTGEIPESLGDCLVLENLYLDENELTGGIPASLSKMPNLKVLHLGSNKFFGEIPSALGNCPVLENLFLYDNELTGKLPEEIINIHTLKQLRIQNNKLNGECSELLTTFIENLDVYYIEQQPGYELKLNFYQSTDFSQDGKVITLQQHTKGPGIKFVITMDGFSDRLIADGTVNSYIQMAYETLFSREPYTSFKEYFDVYAVLTVSKREKLMTDTALQTGGEVDRFILHHDLVEAYAKKIPAINNDMSNTHILVILNDKSGVRANCSWTSYGSMSCASIIMEDNTSRFDGVIRHEVLGHGFGRLADEYVEVGLNGDFSNFPEEDKQGIWDEHKRGWYLNVDVTNDPEKIVWKDFLSNPDYVSENIGIYEGALLYERGAYRATDYSIMRYNTGDFNAPSRWAIYKHIMEIAGEEYSLETFFEYDKKNLVQTRSAGSKSAQSTPIDTRKLGAKPVFLNR